MADVSIICYPDGREYNIKDQIARNLLTSKMNIPSGGSAGNVLKKTSTGIEWANDVKSWNDLIDTPEIPDSLSDLTSDSTHRTVSDTEKATWNSKANQNHNHDDIYYTETEVNNLLATKQNTLLYDTVPTENSEKMLKSGAIKQSIDNVVAVASGKTASYVFDTVSLLDTWLSSSANTSTLKVGDVFLIRNINVPDYWWDGSTKQQLETTKVDLSTYVTTTAMTNALSGKSDSNHNHNNVYYTETEVNTLLSAKANSSSLSTVATSGSYNDLNNTPQSLPANGGNASTVGGYSIWVGSSSSLPSSRSNSTIYFVL